MSLKSKAKAQRKREQLKAEREREAQKLVARAEQLKTMTAGFARTARKPKTEKAYVDAKMPRYEFDRRVEIRHGDPEQRFTGKAPKDRVVLSPEMQAREDAAQERYKEMKSLVQPLGNKMGYQYPDPSYLDASRKGELRRR